MSITNGFADVAKKLNSQKQSLLQMYNNSLIFRMKDPRNPYSTHWSDKILQKRYNLGITVNGFCNGVPLIKFKKLKEQAIPFV
jgi:hypothetical protein